jgi:methylglyoxal reductase
MKYRELGTSGMRASVVGLGTWVMGGGAVWGQEPDDTESIRTLHAALDAGINLIDTAPAYGWGRSEEVIGKAIEGRRDDVILATKCGLWWEDQRGAFFVHLNGKDMYRCLRPETIRIEIENSLRRLKVDCIDLYQTHWPAMDPDKTPIAETMGCLMQLKQQGKIRAIGVSNVTADELRENIVCGEVTSNQPRYSMLYRDIEKDVLPICREHKISVLAYMPLEQGLLTGKVGMDRTFEPDEFRSNADWNPWFQLEHRPRVLQLLEGWKTLTQKYDCTLAQLAIAWTVAQAGVTHALCGARRPQQAVENARGGQIDLAAEDVQRMTSDVDALGTPGTESSS